MPTHNEPETKVCTIEPGTTKRSPGRPPGSPNKYHEEGEGEYSNVTLHLNKKVWAAIRIMAIQDETTITQLVSEALVTWLKWLARAAKEERENGPAELETEAVNRLYLEVMKRQHRDKLSKALKSRAHWHRVYPNKRWPGGIAREILKENSEPDTGNAV